MIPPEIQLKLSSILSDPESEPFRIRETRSCSGGCINEAYQLVGSNNQSYFIKFNYSERFPGMFEAEKQGLSMLAEAAVFRIPMPLSTGNAGKYSFILMEYLEQGRQQSGFWRNFGQKLARLHQQTNTFFGLDHSNYIGSLQQENTPHSNWSTFFIEERLEKQVRLGTNTGKLVKGFSRKFDWLFHHLSELIPAEPPALLHGDLWNGNYLVDKFGEPCLLDPAIYYGHREVDLAMTRLFGGFSPEFYQAYQEIFPLEKEWESRVEIFNLYPLLVHVNLFGGSYLPSVEAILKRF